MWFKKKSQISGYNPNTAEDGTDWRTTSKYQNWSVSQTLPSAADANNYFYLPAFGIYYSGQLSGVGDMSFCWSSSADSWNSSNAYYLYFSRSDVHVASHARYMGFRAEAFQ